MRTSGTQIVERVEFRECNSMVAHTFPMFSDGPKFQIPWACTFKGDVDVSADPETVSASWVCPVCETVHDVSGEVFP